MVNTGWEWRQRVSMEGGFGYQMIWLGIKANAAQEVNPKPYPRVVNPKAGIFFLLNFLFLQMTALIESAYN
jgi:hypothetical protein